MKLGFIGTGIISSALVTGFCESGRDVSVLVSPRTKERAEALRDRYPDQVRIASKNQQIVDESEWIFLAVLPQQAMKVLEELHFGPEKKLISLVPSLDMEEASKLTGPLAVFADVVPLPFAAKRIGPVVLYPPVPEVKELLSILGTVVEAETREQMSILRTSTALMSPYYMLLSKVVSWCESKGLKEEKARTYLTSYWGALSQMAAEFPGPLDELAREATPGGLNWQALNDLEEKGALDEWQKVLDPVLERVRKK